MCLESSNHSVFYFRRRYCMRNGKVQAKYSGLACEGRKSTLARGPGSQPALCHIAPALFLMADLHWSPSGRSPKWLCFVHCRFLTTFILCSKLLIMSHFEPFLRNPEWLCSDKMYLYRFFAPSVPYRFNAKAQRGQPQPKKDVLTG